MEELFNIEADEDFVNIINEILNNLYDAHSKPITLLNDNSVAKVKDEIKDIIFKTECSAERVYELLVSNGFKNERSQILSSLIEKRKSELLYSTLLDYNSAHGETVTSVEWAVKLVYGTSELKKLKYPLLQLALTTLSKGNQQQRIYDINKEMIVSMINVLENIDAIES